MKFWYMHDDCVVTAYAFLAIRYYTMELRKNQFFHHIWITIENHSRNGSSNIFICRQHFQFFYLCYLFRLKFNISLFLWISTTVSSLLFNQRLTLVMAWRVSVAQRTPKLWLTLTTDIFICITIPQRVNSLRSSDTYIRLEITGNKSNNH